MDMPTATATLSPPANAAPQELAPDVKPPEPPPPSPAELLAAQYTGPKAALFPLYQALAHVARRLSPRAKLLPSKAHVVFLQGDVPFAVVRATNRTRLDLGLALPDLTPSLRWKKARGFAGVPRITHRLELTGLHALNAELVGWMKRAVELTRAKGAKPAKAAEPAAAAAALPPGRKRFSSASGKL